MDILINGLEKGDFKNYLDLMNQFRPVETDMTFDKFCEMYDKIFTYAEIYVARDENKIIGSITVIYEQKFIHHGAIYAHIEDVVVDIEYQSTGSKKGLKIGSQLIDYAKQKSMEKNCYKCTLVCNEDLSPFYRKNQFEEKGVHMTYSLIHSEKPIEKHRPVHRENEWTSLTWESFQEIMKSFHSLNHIEMSGACSFTQYNTNDAADTGVGAGGVQILQAGALSLNNGFAIAIDLETYANIIKL
jgi:glucosamine-phosphate N-acetyltransferase